MPLALAVCNKCSARSSKDKLELMLGIGVRTGLAGLESCPAMLTDDLLAEILDTNLQIAAASRAFLHEVRATWHTVSPATGDTSLRLGPGVGNLVYASWGQESMISFRGDGRSIFQARC